MSREPAPRLVAVAWVSAVAVTVFAVAEADGGYGLTSRTIVTVAAWGLLMLAVGFGVARMPAGPARVCCVLFAGFAVWTLASATWASSSELALLEFDRVGLYLGVLVLAIVAVPRCRLADGLFLAIVAIAVVSLTTRFFPGAIGAHRTPLPAAAARLSYPIGYWNGLGILVSFAVPLALRGSTIWRSPAARAAAVAVLPIVACVIELTSSRGAALTAATGTICFVAATNRRWTAVGALLAGSAGSAIAVAALEGRHTLVDGPLASDLAVRQGRSAAVVLLASMALAAVAYAAAERLLSARSTPPVVIGRALVALAVVGVLVVALASHPMRRFDDFKRAPPATQEGPGAHLLSGNGSGRWQFWAAAVDEFRAAPIRGRGAGSFPAWWARHASFSYFVENAHSLYLETLGELGIVGFLLLVGAFGAGLVGCVEALRSSDGDLRVTVAGGAAVFSSFLVAVAIDWVWQLAAVGIAGLAGLAVSIRAPLRTEPRSSRLGVGIAVIVIAWAVVCAAALPWLTAERIGDSQAAIRRGDAAVARKSALDAKSLEPWAASPYVQLALVAESDHRLAEARRWIGGAISRDREDWRSWYLAARIQRESGLAREAARSYAQAQALNPRSPIFGPTTH